MPLAAVPQGFTLRTVRPETPIFSWLTQLDDVLAAMPTTFGDREIVLDLTAARLHGPGTRALVLELLERDFRIIGLTGISHEALGPEAAKLPPILRGGPTPPERQRDDAAPATPAAAALVVARNIRSGQVIANPGGDVTIVGSVASGAEIVAAGSIHVYGTLQGRAIAGSAGSIFCQRLEAELLRIGDAFLAADDMPAALRGRATRAWWDGDAIRFAALT